MRITKYIHSCVLIEEEGDAILFDPGTFSFKDARVTPELFTHVKLIVITHNHPDHYDADAIKKIVELSHATIFTTEEVVASLVAAGVEADFSTALDATVGLLQIKAIPAAHERILSDELPENYGYLINDRVLHPGDSFADALADTNPEVLLLPITAPWTTDLHVMDFSREAAPKTIIPIHDGYVKDFFQDARHAAFKNYLGEEGMAFVSLKEPGDSIEI